MENESTALYQRFVPIAIITLVVLGWASLISVLLS